MTQPLLSVVVMIDRQRQRAQECLEALVNQNAIGEMEVVLLDFAHGESAPLPAVRHPNLRVVKATRGLAFGEAKAQGVELCHSPVVAFVEEHVQVFPGWAEAVIRAHKEPHAAIGGEIHNGNPGMGISDVIAIMNYTSWLPPAKRQESQQLDSHNTTYKRDRLLKYKEQLPFWLSNEVVFHKKLVEDGQKLLCEPAIKHAHINESDMTICKGYYLFNRVLAGRRRQLSSRAIFTTLPRVWFLPFVRTARFLQHMHRDYPQYFGIAARNIHTILMTQAFSAAGQLMGALGGVGDADKQFLDYEMNVKRRTIDPE